MKKISVTLAAVAVLGVSASSFVGITGVEAASNNISQAKSSSVISIDPFYNTSNIIKGEAPGAVRVELSVEGKKVGSTFVASSMFFFSTAGLGINEPGATFTLTAYNTYGQVMDESTFVTQMDSQLIAPTINAYREGMPYVNGSISGKYVAAILFVDGEKVADTYVASGQYVFWGTNKLNLKKGQKIEVAGMVSNGVLGPKATTFVQ